MLMTKTLIPLDKASLHTLYMRLYRAKKGEALSQKEMAYGVEYRSRNRDKISAQQAEWRKDNKAQIAVRVASRYHQTKDRKRGYDIAYRIAKKKEIAAYMLAWRVANAEVKANHDRNRKARKKNAEGSHTLTEIKGLMVTQGGTCVYCNVDITQGFHADHIHPLIRGGSNWIENIQLLCATCNISKGDKTHSEFLEYLKVTASLRPRSSADRASVF